MVELILSETSVIIYQSAQCDIPDDLDFQQQSYENLKYQSLSDSFSVVHVNGLKSLGPTLLGQDRGMEAITAEVRLK
jgi:hypothetical protein